MDPAHERSSEGQATRTFLQLLSMDSACSVEDLPGAMDDEYEWQ